MKQLLFIFLVFVIEGFVLWGIGQIKTSSHRSLAFNINMAVKAGIIRSHAHQVISEPAGKKQLYRNELIKVRATVH